MLVERLFVLGIVAGLALITIVLWRLHQARRLQLLAKTPLPDDLTMALPTGPALLYFTTASCTQCHFQQEPILAQFAATTITPIHTIDAVVHERLANFFGILTVPTTIWLDQKRKPIVINHGLASLNQLRDQASKLGMA